MTLLADIATGIANSIGSHIRLQSGQECKISVTNVIAGRGDSALFRVEVQEPGGEVVSANVNFEWN